MGAVDQVQMLRVARPVNSLEQLFPVFTPASIFESGRWRGPFERLGASGVGLTWAIDAGRGGIQYLDDRTSRRWEIDGIDWRTAAMRNLRRQSGKLYTHALGHRRGHAYGIAMMHADGWGPSRLLLHRELQSIFPYGYRVAIPERSCGVAVAENLAPDEQKAIEELVQTCFLNGARPLSPGIFGAHEILSSWSMSREHLRFRVQV